MKKKPLLLLVILLVLSGAVIGVVANQYRTKEEKSFFNSAKKIASDKTVSAIVNGEKIYQHQIDIKKTSQELSRKNAELSGFDASQITVDSEEVILKELIRNTVVLQEAKRQGLTAKLKEAKIYIEENYREIIKKDDENSQFIKEYMDELGWSEKEYLKQAAIAYQDELTRANLYNDFTKDMSGTYEQKVSEYESYVDRLINKSDIE